MKAADLTVEEFENIIHNIIEEEIEDLYFILDPILERSIRKAFLSFTASGPIEDD